jgi:hypothetical protein
MVIEKYSSIPIILKEQLLFIRKKLTLKEKFLDNQASQSSSISSDRISFNQE